MNAHEFTRQPKNEPLVSYVEWKHRFGNKVFEECDLSPTSTFLTYEGVKYRRVDKTLAIRETKRTKSYIASWSRDHVFHHSDDAIYGTTIVIPAHTKFIDRGATTMWVLAPIVYYGTRIEETHSIYGSAVSINHSSTMLYSHRETPETPHAFPLITRHKWSTDAQDLTPEFLELIQGNTQQNLLPFLEKRTVLSYVQTISEWRRDVKKWSYWSHSSTSEPVVPVVYLTDISTRKNVPPLTKKLEARVVYESNGPFRLSELETIRQRNAAFKMELAERVFHPDRVERIAAREGIALDEYLDILA